MNAINGKKKLLANPRFIILYWFNVLGEAKSGSPEDNALFDSHDPGEIPAMVASKIKKHYNLSIEKLYSNFTLLPVKGLSEEYPIISIKDEERLFNDIYVLGLNGRRILTKSEFNSLVKERDLLKIDSIDNIVFYSLNGKNPVIKERIIPRDETNTWQDLVAYKSDHHY